MKHTSLILLFCTIGFPGLHSLQSQSQDEIIAKVGNKKITVREFMERSELTIRPNNFKDKRTTLNNLITEKILALESEKKVDQAKHPGLNSTVEGIKEQLMRNKLYSVEAENKAKTDTKEIQHDYRLSLREYELDFFAFRNTEIVQKIQHVLDSIPELTDDMFREVEEILGKRPVHKVNYTDPDDDVIHEALFSTLLDTGTVIGPLKLANGEYILMKIRDWKEYPLIGGQDQQERWNKVQKKIFETKTRKLWGEYLASLMKGKRLEFDRESFTTLSDISYEYYLKNSANDSLKAQLSEIPLSPKNIDLTAPLFTIDKKTWTIGDFKKKLMRHPLVFRTTALNKDNFPEQFKLAIVDMVRDHYLTQKAYKQGLNKSNDVKERVEMWKDSFLASVYLKNVIDTTMGHNAIMQNDLNSKISYRESYIRSLQNAYGKSIWINYDLLNKITITKVDFFAMQPGVPYPSAVPTFPSFLPSENLDYAKRKK